MAVKKKDTGLEITSITLSNYVRPKVVENKSRNWVLNGRNNSFYQYLIDRHNGSPTNSSINNSYIDLIYGRGLTFTNGNAGVNDWAKLQTILRPKELRKIIADFQIFGEFSFQVIKTKGGGLSSIEHLGKQNVVPSIANEDNEIENYWFSRDWTRIQQNTPEEFAAFGTSKDAIEMYVGKPYKVGKVYFSDPDYLAGLPYCEMEEEIANLNVNYIQKGLSGGYMVSVPDGKNWTDEQKNEFERNIKSKLVGSPNAGDFVLSFNGRDQESIQIESFPVNEQIHKQWSFLVEEAKQQILTSHRATSPSLVGIISSSGFSNTADEMDMAEAQLMKRVIKPKQDFVLEALEEVLLQYGINLDLVFKPLTEVKQEPVEPVSMCTHLSSDEGGASEEMANSLIEFGETLEEENWLLLSTADVDYDTDDDLFGLVQFATSTGTARPNSKSSQDSEDIAIRYRYVGNPLPERLFCKKMMFANKLYRKEDILQMDKSGVNDGFGLNGSNSYSIWLWKGGGKLSTAFPNGTCKHKWQREIYLKRGGGVDANSPLAKTISTSEARRRGYKVPVNDSDVSVTPNRNKS